MIKAAVAGIAGKMGTLIAKAIAETEDLELVGGFERPDHPKVGSDISEIIGGVLSGILIHDSIKDVIDYCDVVVDFTNASASLRHLECAAAKGKPMVIGSTGFSNEQMVRVKELTGVIPCVLSPNMSIGVNVLFKIVEEVASLLGDTFDVEIIEAHHRFKKDAPSGTAIKIGQIVARALGRDFDKVGLFSRYGITGERPKEIIGIQSVRAGDIVGEHTVLFAGVGERIELTHRAHSRDGFAKGAVWAARWVVNQRPGLYDMQDVLGIK